MINMLIDSLPTTVEVAGREFVIASDFRTSILYEQLMQDPDIEERDKILAASRLYFPDEFPGDYAEAMNKIIWFYSCGKELQEFQTDQSSKPKRNRFGGKRLYDYDIDAPYFYAAFLSQYGIDLQDVEYMHWWKFQALFLGLSENQRLSQIMEYRAIDISKIKNRAERERYAALQNQYRLPDIRSKKQKQHDVGSMFGVFAP